MGIVTVAALVVCGGYAWLFSDDHGLVPFLLGCALLAIAVLHAIAWRDSRTPLLIADPTGLRVRLGGRWAGVPWAEVEAVEVSRRSGLGDGKVIVRPRDELRIVADLRPRGRAAVLLNRWLYDAALVVPFGITTRLSEEDVAGALVRLADGRVPVTADEDQAREPESTVEVAAAGTLRREGEPPAEPATRRLASVASVVSALRAHAGRTSEATAPINLGALALSSRVDQPTESLPELAELRRRAPEDEPAPVSAELAPSAGTGNVELIIDATTDLSAQAMRKVRRSGDADPAPAGPDELVDPVEPVSVPSAPQVPPNERIGIELRDAREWLGLSVDELAERTRIRPYVIESIEVGDFSPCGGDFYARGHLRMLAGVLGIDAAPLISTYDADLAGAPVSPRAVFEAELATGTLRRTGGGGSRWGVLIGAVLVLLLVWGLARVFLTDSDAEPGSSASLTRSVSAAAAPGSGDTLLISPPVPDTRVTLRVAQGQSRVVVWDKAQRVVFSGTLRAGGAKSLSGPGPMRVLALNAGAVSLAVDGRQPAPMGRPGQRVTRQVG